MTLAQKMAAVLDELRALPKSREASLAITNFEQCAFWASCAMQGVTSPIDWVNGTQVAKEPKS